MNGPGNHNQVSKETILQMYQDQGMSMKLIAESLGFKSAASIKNRMDASGSKHPSWRGGEYTTTKGYLKVSRPKHPRATTTGYVLKHIIIWEEEHGHALPPDFVIHHINGIKYDNRPENLLALKHQKHHWAIVLNETRKRVQELEAENRRLTNEQTRA